MAEFLDVEGGRIAYDVTGSGPLVVLSHGIGDRRQAYRFLAPKLAQAGYRVVQPMLDSPCPRRSALYLDVAYPTKPADYAEYMAALAAKLREPGRVAEFMKTGKTTPADAAAQLPNVTVPALIIMGTLDPDFADPRAEGDAIVAALPSALGTVAMVEGAGHYPHAQSPDQVAALVIGFLKEHARA
jgi:pimeloyl-ACP methyl ester carboxylesterase